MTYLAQLTTTFTGMKHSFDFAPTLDAAYSNLVVYLLETYNGINDIYIDAVQSKPHNYDPDELSYIELPHDINEIENIESDNFSFSKTNNTVSIWFRYRDGDIYATITNVSNQVTLKQ